ncbi:hypothetical protein EBR43_08005 [bacterium]|nr:hypothetical protein [bacterium]
MRTWKATFLVMFVMALFAYLTFIKENPISCWWWVLGVFFIIQTYLHDAVEDYSEEIEDDKDE